MDMCKFLKVFLISVSMNLWEYDFRDELYAVFDNSDPDSPSKVWRSSLIVSGQQPNPRVERISTTNLLLEWYNSDFPTEWEKHASKDLVVAAADVNISMLYSGDEEGSMCTGLSTGSGIHRTNWEYQWKYTNLVSERGKSIWVLSLRTQKHVVVGRQLPR